MKAKIIISFITLILASLPLYAAEISVAADRNPVTLEESFHLVFSSSSDVDDEPDFSPLEKDFEVLGTRQSSQISIINGRKSSEKKWIVSLLPKHSGRITIPVIAFGRDRSHTATITVKQSGDDSEKGREIFIEMESDPAEVYVQQQIAVTVRVFRSIAVANASLSSLTVSDVNSFVEQLADDRNYRTRIDGQVYDVYERHYVLYPQESGDLVINPVRFKATTGYGRFFADPFGGGQPKSVIRRSEELSIKVKPVPATFTGNDWLPVKSLQLDETWSHDPLEFRVGEPVTRTITLSGRGLLASQLPELSADLPGSFKAYPDQPVLKNESLARDIVGIREEKIAIIPSDSGRFTLPEIRIPYWSVKSETMEEAILPGQTIEVLPPLTGTLPVQQMPQSVPPAATAESPVTSPTQPEITAQQTSAVWKWLCGILFVTWLLTLWLWWRSMHRSVNQTPDREVGRPERLLKIVQQACNENDPVACKQALLQWAASNWNVHPPRSPGEISRRLDDTIGDEFDALNNALYSSTRSQWDGSRFWQAFSTAIKNRKQDAIQEGESLEPMFRIS